MGGLLQEVQPFFVVRIIAIRFISSRAQLRLVGWLSRWILKRMWGMCCCRIRVGALMGGSRKFARHD